MTEIKGEEEKYIEVLKPLNLKLLEKLGGKKSIRKYRDLYNTINCPDLIKIFRTIQL